MIMMLRGANVWRLSDNPLNSLVQLSQLNYASQWAGDCFLINQTTTFNPSSCRIYFYSSGVYNPRAISLG